MQQLLQNPYSFFYLLACANILMYVITIIVSYFWSQSKGHSTLKLTRVDVVNSLQILFVNILVAVPGYYLLKGGVISFISEGSFLLDFLFLVLIFDFTMYVLHLISHYVWPFKYFHLQHHTHHYFNAISLYVMAPIEAILFGTLLTLTTLLFTFNIYSLLLFIFFNWIFGVIGHLNTSATKLPRFFGNSIFHQTHHQQPNCNFGFYTVFWDNLFGTVYREKQ